MNERCTSLTLCYQWDATASAWKKVGDTIDKPKAVQKQVYEGVEYDYIFDVDVEDGVPPLKLPYNITGEPNPASLNILPEDPKRHSIWGGAKFYRTS